LDFSSQIEDNRRALIADVLRRLEEQLWPFHYALDAFLAQLFKAVIPHDWREKFHAFIAEQKAKGFKIAESSVSELETWIEAWAKDCKLWPEEMVEQFAEDEIDDESESTFIISVVPEINGPPDEAGKSVPPQHEVTIKHHLPADWRGTWISGTKGNGEFEFNDHPRNKRWGIVGARIRYADGFSVEGGFPPEAYYEKSAEKAKVTIERILGRDADNLACDTAMRVKRRNPNWVRPAGFTWHHAGPPGSLVMELIDDKYHRPTAHSGGASLARKLLRIKTKTNQKAGQGNTPKNSKGVTGRVFAVLAVYLTVRDALREAGVLQPEYTVLEREEYTFLASDGSLFVVFPAGWSSNAAIEFVDGPRKGQREEIDSDQVAEYKLIAEKVFGRYVPETLFSEPRFLPGSERRRLPLVEVDEFGYRTEVGWIDETGVHRIEPRYPGYL
jgi:hypothetical protein